MAREIEYERTFLAKHIPQEIVGEEGTLLHDIMVPDTVRHPHLRLRQKGSKYVITKKYPLRDGDITEMVEETIPLDKEEFEALKKCSTKDIVKRRYNVAIDGYPAEVDVFEEKLRGLVLIDFEFSTSADKDAFIVPGVCLADVSQEEMLAGGILAGRSYDEIEPTLVKYGYGKL